jgi:hypothetical protein
MKEFGQPPENPVEITTCIPASYWANGRKLACQLRYTAADPAAAAVKFENPGGNPVQWTFARDLLRAGLYAPTGQGDIHITPCEDDAQTIAMMLRSPDGEACIFFDREVLEDYLNQTDIIVPPAEEGTRIAHQIDQELARLSMGNSSI